MSDNETVDQQTEDAPILSKRVYNVVTLGNTGVGKSALLNMIAGRDAFAVGDRAASETQMSSSTTCIFNHFNEDYELRLFDTQGQSDSDGNDKDKQHIANMVDYVRQFDTIDLFVLCFDGTNPRLTACIQSTISIFRKIFPDFLFHTVLVFNKWTHASVKKRNRLEHEYQEIFRRQYFIEQMPCYFIDSFANREMLRDNDDGSQSVRALHPNIKNRTRSQVNDMIAFLLLKGNSCNVSHIQVHDTELTSARKELDSLRNEIEQVRIENEENKRRLKETIELLNAASLQHRDVEIEKLRQENAYNERKLNEKFNKTIEQMNREHAANMERVKAEMERNKNWWWHMMAFFGWK